MKAKKKNQTEQLPIPAVQGNIFTRKIDAIIDVVAEYFDDLRDDVRGAIIDAKITIKNKVLGDYRMQIKGIGWGWTDKDSIMLHANFQILVNYVEKENAKMFDYCGGEKYFGEATTGREKGLAILLHDDGIDPTLDEGLKQVLKDNRKNDLKAVELYKWWSDVRPNRVDPWDSVVDRPGDSTDLTAWLNPSAKMRKSAAYKKYVASVHATNEQEEKDYNEDSAKLIELIKIRRSLWT